MVREDHSNLACATSDDDTEKILQTRWGHVNQESGAAKGYSGVINGKRGTCGQFGALKYWSCQKQVVQCICFLHMYDVRALRSISPLLRSTIEYHCCGLNFVEPDCTLVALSDPKPMA